MTNQAPSVQASKPRITQNAVNIQRSTNNQTSKERPILFSGEMVRAILDGRKTQTRRIVKPQPIKQHHIVGVSGQGAHNMTGKFQFEVRTHYATTVECIACPHGVISDRLWVKETFQYTDEHLNYQPGYVYRATDPDWDNLEGWEWKPSIFMPRRASRILLEIVSIRVERLREISEEDCVAEGVKPEDCWEQLTEDRRLLHNCQWVYKKLWESINGLGSWKRNPWVWAITFKRLKAEG